MITILQRANLAVTNILKVAVYAQISVGPTAVQFRETMEYLDKVKHFDDLCSRYNDGRDKVIIYHRYHGMQLFCPCP